MMSVIACLQQLSSTFRLDELKRFSATQLKCRIGNTPQETFTCTFRRGTLAIALENNVSLNTFVGASHTFWGIFSRRNQIGVQIAGLTTSSHER